MNWWVPALRLNKSSKKSKIWSSAHSNYFTRFRNLWYHRWPSTFSPLIWCTWIWFLPTPRLWCLNLYHNFVFIIYINIEAIYPYGNIDNPSMIEGW
jgi:hypothetical protein